MTCTVRDVTPVRGFADGHLAIDEPAALADIDVDLAALKLLVALALPPMCASREPSAVGCDHEGECRHDKERRGGPRRTRHDEQLGHAAILTQPRDGTDSDLAQPERTRRKDRRSRFYEFPRTTSPRVTASRAGLSRFNSGARYRLARGSTLRFTPRRRAARGTREA